MATAKELRAAAERVVREAMWQLSDYREQEHDDPDLLASIDSRNECGLHILATVREDDDEPVTEEWLRAKDQNGHDDISALLDEVDRLRYRYSTEVRDNCEADTAIRDIVRPVIGDAAVDGDSIHRPGMVDVVQMVVDRLRAENRQLTNANAHLQQEVNFLRRRPE